MTFCTFGLALLLACGGSPDPSAAVVGESNVGPAAVPRGVAASPTPASPFQPRPGTSRLAFRPGQGAIGVGRSSRVPGPGLQATAADLQLPRPGLRATAADLQLPRPGVQQAAPDRQDALPDLPEAAPDRQEVLPDLPEAAPDRWLAEDKLRHAFMSFGATALTFGAASTGGLDTGAALVAAGSAAIGAGIWKEWRDARTPGETSSGKDLVWDALGVAAGLLLMSGTR